MFPLGEDELEVVVHVTQGGCHLLIAEWPVAMGVVEVISAVLQPDAKGFGFGGADEVRVGVATADVGEGADSRKDSAELVWALPSGGEGADTAAAGTAEGALGWIAGQWLDLSDCREDFFDQEAGVVAAQSVIFEAAVVGSPRALRGGGVDFVARVDEDANGGWHGSAVDEVVKNGGHAPSSVEVDVVMTVLEDHDGGGLGGVGLNGEVHPPVARGVWKNLAAKRLHLAQFTLRHAGLGQLLWGQGLSQAGRGEGGEDEAMDKAEKVRTAAH